MNYGKVREVSSTYKREFLNLKRWGDVKVHKAKEKKKKLRQKEKETK